MSEIKVNRDSKLIKVLASEARGERIDSDRVEEAAKIISELASDPTPQNRHQIAQTIAFTVDELQKGELDFLNQVADQKNIGYGDKATFNVKTGGIKAYIQAKGSTTKRSYVSDRQVTVDTVEISARPAINVVDLRSGRINMADLIRDANREITNKKLAMVEGVLHDAIDDYQSPFYATGTGINKATLDAQLAYFKRLGPVTILGDQAAVSQLTALTGLVMNPGSANDLFTQRSHGIIDEANANGYIGRYNGSAIISLANTYFDGTTTPVLATDWLYLIPGGMSGDARNLKIVNEGNVNAFESQSIDDMVYEVRLDQWFGAAFVSGKLPTIGAYLIG